MQTGLQTFLIVLGFAVAIIGIPIAMNIASGKKWHG